jgi:hypothetical protein
MKFKKMYKKTKKRISKFGRNVSKEYEKANSGKINILKPFSKTKFKLF